MIISNMYWITYIYPYRMIYMEAPFANIIEIYSHSYELHYSRASYSLKKRDLNKADHNETLSFTKK